MELKCTLPFTHGNMYQCILDGVFYKIGKPAIPSVLQTTATTPVKGSLSTERITTAKDTLPTSSYHDITTHSSSTSESTIVPRMKCHRH